MSERSHTTRCPTPCRLHREGDDVYDHSLLTRRAQERILVRATEFLDREAPV